MAMKIVTTGSQEPNLVLPLGATEQYLLTVFAATLITMVKREIQFYHP